MQCNLKNLHIICHQSYNIQIFQKKNYNPFFAIKCKYCKSYDDEDDDDAEDWLVTFV